MTLFIDLLGIEPADPGQTGRPGDDAGLRLLAEDQHSNSNGTVHGGVIATLIDCVMGDAVRAGLDEDESCVTVSMTITYLTPGELGSELVASAEVRKRGDKLVMAEADVVSGDTPVAHGVATYSVTKTI